MKQRRTRWCRLAARLAAVSGLVLLAAPATAERPRSFAVRGATVVTGTGEIVEGGTVVMEDGLITAVGVDAAIPPEAWVIEGEGLYVYPGLVDGMSTLGLAPPREEGRRRGGRAGPSGEAEERPRFAAGPEDRPATTPWRTAAEELPDEIAGLERWRSAGFAAAVGVPTGGIVAGQASLWQLAGERARERVVATPLALRIDLEPVGSFRSFPGSLMGVIAYVKQLFADARHYRDAWAHYRRDPRGRPRPGYDRALEALVAAVAENRPVLLPARRPKEIRRALGLARELGVRPVLYGGHGAAAVVDELRASGAAVLVGLDWPKREEDADPEADIPLRTLRDWRDAPAAPAALARAGVPFALVTGGAVDGPDEALAAVRRAIEAGLAPADALAALTIGPARIFGVDDRLGSLEVGKIANAVVTKGALFDAETSVEAVFVDGRKYEPVPPEPSGRSTEEEEVER